MGKGFTPANRQGVDKRLPAVRALDERRAIPKPRRKVSKIERKGLKLMQSIFETDPEQTNRLKALDGLYEWISNDGAEFIDVKMSRRVWRSLMESFDLLDGRNHWENFYDDICNKMLVPTRDLEKLTLWWTSMMECFMYKWVTLDKYRRRKYLVLQRKIQQKQIMEVASNPEFVSAFRASFQAGFFSLCTRGSKFIAVADPTAQMQSLNWLVDDFRDAGSLNCPFMIQLWVDCVVQVRQYIDSGSAATGIVKRFDTEVIPDLPDVIQNALKVK